MDLKMTPFKRHTNLAVLKLDFFFTILHLDNLLSLINK